MLCCSDWCPKYKDCAKAIDNQEYTNRLEQIESLYNYGSCSIQYVNDKVITKEDYVCGPTSNYAMFIPKYNPDYDKAIEKFKEIKEMPTVPTCPNCGCTRAYYRYTVSTLMGYTQIVDNGKIECCDPNWHTTFYTCTQCHHEFRVVERYGKIERIEDEGHEPDIMVVNAPITVKAGENANIMVKTSDMFKTNIEVDLHKLNEEIEKAKEQIKKLDSDIRRKKMFY